MSRKLLSVIVSTHNRSDLLINNLKTMLQTKLTNIEFIVCDNGSSDDTWVKLCTLDDTRLIRRRNYCNYGFDNFWLMSFESEAQYFMFMNDRDYITCNNLEWICEKLLQITEADFISCDRNRYSVGYYTWKDAIPLYFQSRHPGTLIYRTDFCRQVLRRETIRKYLVLKQPWYANNYLVFQLLLNVKQVYAGSAFMIEQPKNRELIPKERKEYYDCAYISVAYRVHEYHDWLSYAEKFKGNERTKYILRAIYKDSFITVTREYYTSLQIPGFKERNHCEELKTRDWFLNGIRFCRECYKIPTFPHSDMNSYILFTTFFELLKTLFFIFSEPLRKLKRAIKKEWGCLWTI